MDMRESRNQQEATSSALIERARETIEVTKELVRERKRIRQEFEAFAAQVDRRAFLDVNRPPSLKDLAETGCP